MKIEEDANENNKSTLPGLILAESIKQDYINLHDMIKGPVVLQVSLIYSHLLAQCQHNTRITTPCNMHISG